VAENESPDSADLVASAVPEEETIWIGFGL
jgi:hypothetical protein